MTDPDPDETLNNKFAPEGWGADMKAPSHLRPYSAGRYLTEQMVPKLWAEIKEIQVRIKEREKQRRYREWLAR